MDTETAQLFVGLLTIAAGVGALTLVVLRVLAAAGNDDASRLGSSVSESGVWLAWLVALGATLGSLYFSEVADFTPCRLCWFQRIAMYPLSVILLVGALRHERRHGGPVGELDGGAVQAESHGVDLSRCLSGANGSASPGIVPDVSSVAITSPVIGASSTPLR